MEPLALVANSDTKWHNLCWLQIKPPGGATCIGLGNPKDPTNLRAGNSAMEMIMSHHLHLESNTANEKQSSGERVPL